MASPPSERTRVKRAHDLAVYDRAAIEEILDRMPLASVAYVIDGKPLVTPTLQWREGGNVYWHGSAASRMLESVDGAEVCINVTIVDGMVLARSGFNHSVNYRSVTLFGTARAVTDATDKARRLEVFTEQQFPGRWPTLRPMTAKELKATAILSLPIDEASAKVSTGGPNDDPGDESWPVWAGVVPLRLAVEPAVAASDLAAGIVVPGHVRNYRIG